MTTDKSSAESLPPDEQQKTGKNPLKKAGKGVLTVASKTTGADIIFRDLRRVRPRHPQLWKDIFSPRKTLREMKDRNEAGANKIPLTKAAKSAALTSVVGLLICTYGVTYIAQGSGIEDLSTLNKITLSAFVAAGCAQTVIYGWITVKLMHRQKMTSRVPTTPAKKRRAGK